MKKLYGRIGEPLEWNTNKELEFVDYVEAAKRTFAKRKNSEVNVTKFIETEVE